MNMNYDSNVSADSKLEQLANSKEMAYDELSRRLLARK